MKTIKFICIFIGIVVLIILSSCYKDGSIFSDEIYQDTIKQNTGGIIIRNIHHYNDFQSIYYQIQYSYKDTHDSLCIIGSGYYRGKRPPQNEQLISVGKWLVFKTSGGKNKDFVFICDSKTRIWIKYEMSYSEIESTDLWMKQHIESAFAGDTFAKVENIDGNGNITVLYVYAKKNRIFSFSRGKRKITYKINLETGVPEMKVVSKV